MTVTFLSGRFGEYHVRERAHSKKKKLGIPHREYSRNRDLIDEIFLQ
jgi:hypothetical protein